ncbi:MAG: hypothetical protein DI534_11940 [Leifsonia xyli]|nr:MAG: hypothetical protein DI534_11940 [Leifsonia xyli]
MSSHDHLCEACGARFTSSRPEAVYCRQSCRMRAFRERRADARRALLREVLDTTLRLLERGELAELDAAYDRFDAEAAELRWPPFPRVFPRSA